MRTWRVGDVRSLGFRTDLMPRSMDGSAIEERTGYLVVRTPANPGFRWGNFVLFAGPPTRTDGPAVFAAEFPGAAHVAIGVDSTEGGVVPDLGLTAEVNSVLTARHLPDGLVVGVGDDDEGAEHQIRLYRAPES